MTVEATDSTSKKGTLHVDVIVKNVDEPPDLNGPDTVDDFPENSAITRQVGRYTATDPERATVTLSLTGTGSSDFALASNGVLTFKDSPDFEEQGSYSVTVRAVAGSHTVNQPVTVSIQNVEEAGTVALSTLQPQEGVEIEATLEDDDIPSSTAWQWYRASSRGSTGTAITNAISRFFTPVAGDMGVYLRAVATYDDGHGTGKSAAAVTANRVQEAPPVPLAPVYPVDGNYLRSVPEDVPIGRSVGAPVTATDGNGDRLTYTMSSSDAFEIVDSTGQIRTRAGLDHESAPTQTVTVTATDPGDDTDSVNITITVEDVDETPVVTGPTAPEFAENGSGAVATYSATDPDEDGIQWVLAGADSDEFTLSGGTLQFNEVPDFEEKSSYRLTVEAHEQGDGTSVGRLSVTVQVTNVDEPGVVETNVAEPRVRQAVRLSLEDEDGGESVSEWKWERGDPSSPCVDVNGESTVTNWETISGVSGSSYTPTAADQGKCLRATAFYSDRAGGGRTQQFLTPESVEVGPYFDSAAATASIQENSPEDRNVGRFPARHSNSGETLTYSLSGGDTSYFTIDDTGQLRTSATPLDYEGQPGPEATVEITAGDNSSQTATITVTVNVTDECSGAGEPPCAPGRPSVRYDSSTDTNLLVSWSAPGTPSGTAVAGYDLRYRDSGGDIWISEVVTGTDPSFTIRGLTRGATYEVQVRAMNDASGQYGEWSQSGSGRPGIAPPPPPPPPPPVVTTETTGTGGGTGSSGGGGGGGGFAFSGGAAFGGGAPAGPPRPPALVGPQAVTRLFAPLLENGTLERVWRFNNEDKLWAFYDPRPIFAQFNTLRLVRPPVILIVRVNRAQVFRGERLNAGWNYISVR